MNVNTSSRMVLSLWRTCPIHRSLSFAKRADGRFTPRCSSATVYDKWKSWCSRSTRFERRRKYLSMQRCLRFPNAQCCKPYNKEANTAELTNLPFSCTRGFSRLTIDRICDAWPPKVCCCPLQIGFRGIW